jgi:hypothetical protein
MADILFASHVFEMNFRYSWYKLQALRTSSVCLFTAVGRCAYRNFQRDRQLIYTDKSLSAFSDSSCQHACDVEREFVCRSYTFLSTVSNRAHVATDVETLRSSRLNRDQQMFTQFTTHTKSPDSYALLLSRNLAYSHHCNCSTPTYLLPLEYLTCNIMSFRLCNVCVSI